MKATTLIERDFLYLGEKNGEKYYKECLRHFIVITTSKNQQVKKLDKEILGALYKEDNVRVSTSGVYEHTFSDGQTRRLIAVG